MKEPCDICGCICSDKKTYLAIWTIYGETEKRIITTNNKSKARR